MVDQSECRFLNFTFKTIEASETSPNQSEQSQTSPGPVQNHPPRGVQFAEPLAPSSVGPPNQSTPPIPIPKKESSLLLSNLVDKLKGGALGSGNNNGVVASVVANNSEPSSANSSQTASYETARTTRSTPEPEILSEPESQLKGRSRSFVQILKFAYQKSAGKIS